MPKNIVVFSDGTGQKGGEGANTNVYKLYNMVEDRTSDQVAFYDPGLGTNWRKLTGYVSGGGVSKNILDCYEFIFENYEAGDHIYLFGFSRGATTVRSLSNFIHLFGILPRARKDLIKRAWSIYKIKNEKKRNAAAKAFIAKHHTMWANIKFLGVWDTVAALGIPWKRLDNLVDKIPFFRHQFQDLRLSESVENAYHALAIDDERRVFHPTLWHVNNCHGDTLLCDHQSIRQVWFSGMHTDVGGGYDKQGLSDIALDWMMDMAVRHDLKIYPKHKVSTAPNPDGHMHDSREGRLKKMLYSRKVRSWNSAIYGKPVVHESVLMRMKNRLTLLV